MKEANGVAKLLNWSSASLVPDSFPLRQADVKRLEGSTLNPEKKVPCIYCNSMFDPSQEEGDHIIPAALGEFRNDVRFREICPDCNHEMGKSEQQMLQCGPERIFRDIVVPATSRSRGKRSSWTGAQGMPPPEIQAVTESALLRALPTPGDPTNVRAPDQWVLFEENGTQHHIDLFPGKPTSSLKAEVKALNIGKISKTLLHSSEANYDEYMKTIHDGWPSSRSEDLPGMKVGTIPVPLDIKFKVSDRYFRAIAKIAFHYFLAHSSRFRGDEDCFAGIREFIKDGGDRDTFFNTSPIFRDTESNYVPNWWVHVLAATEKDNMAIAYVCLFRGPSFEGNAYHVNLGTPPPYLVITPRAVWAHCYEYDNPVPNRGMVGSVSQVKLTRLG